MVIVPFRLSWRPHRSQQVIVRAEISAQTSALTIFTTPHCNGAYRDLTSSRLRINPVPSTTTTRRRATDTKGCDPMCNKPLTLLQQRVFMTLVLKH
jgi:hypothetical protein